MIILVAILAPALGVWIYQIAFLRNSDIDRFNEMRREREIASTKPPSQTNQHRKQVQKDIWFSQTDGSRLHYQIASEGSLLSLTPIANKFDVVESLQGVKCWMQDKLAEDDGEEIQQARLIEAKTGEYRYTTQEFKANSVLLSLFKLPGHVLPVEPIKDENPFLSGIAKDISVIFSGKTPQFQAENFEATVVKE